MIIQGFVLLLLVLDLHQTIDSLIEQEKAKTKRSLGTTKKGIGPTYSAKCGRVGLRVYDLYTDKEVLKGKWVRKGKKNWWSDEVVVMKWLWCTFTWPYTWPFSWPTFT